MRRSAILIVAAALLVPLTVALALDGKGGYTASSVFTDGDVEDLGDWSGIDVRFGFDGAGTPNEELIAVDSSGLIYTYAWGDDAAGDWYNGVVRFDPDTTALDSILLEEFHFLDENETEWYGNIDCLAVSPVTAGGLTEDQLVLVRNAYDSVTESYSFEVTTLDPDDPTDETLLFAASGGGLGQSNLVIDDASGDIYLLNQTQGATWGAIFQYQWNDLAADYDETAITTAGKAKWGLLWGPNGYLYSFDGTTSTAEDIIRIDPTGFDDISQYASLSGGSSYGGTRFRGWSFDSSGNFWIGVRDVEKGKTYSFVTDVPSGGTVAFKDRIAEVRGAIKFYALGTGPAGEIYVAERDDSGGAVSYTVYELAEGSGGGPGGGNGKGKNK
jgi:hypothetical protein